jgi:hypothetical protein
VRLHARADYPISGKRHIMASASCTLISHLLNSASGPFAPRSHRKDGTTAPGSYRDPRLTIPDTGAPEKPSRNARGRLFAVSQPYRGIRQENGTAPPPYPPPGNPARRVVGNDAGYSYWETRLHCGLSRNYVVVLTVTLPAQELQAPARQE